MKELIRMKHLQYRNSLSEKKIGAKSAAITEKLFSLPEFQQAKAVLFYASFGNEVQTMEMIEKALALGKTVCVPVTSFREKKIEISQISGIAELKEKPNGLVEPETVRACPIEEIGLVVVPGIAFDQRGCRIGYGGGFYDRLLLKAPRNLKAVGLCFNQNIEDKLPAESHDVKMNKIVTEERIIEVVP